MDNAIVQEPMREGSLGTHHVGVLLGAHAELVFLCQRRTIAAVFGLTPRRARPVRRRSVFIGLWYYGCGFLLLLSLAELLRERFGVRRGGCIAEDRRGRERDDGARLRTEEKIGSGNQKARYRLEGSHCLGGTALSKYCYCPGDGDRSSSRFRPKVSPAPALFVFARSRRHHQTPMLQVPYESRPFLECRVNCTLSYDAFFA